MNNEPMYDDYDPDDDDEEETVSYRSPGSLIKRHHDECYKRKVSNVMRSCYHIFCPFGHSHAKRYALWQAMNSVCWRGHCRRGWYDPMFMKNLHNARVRYTSGTIPNGNYYRKISTRQHVGWSEDEGYETLPSVFAIPPLRNLYILILYQRLPHTGRRILFLFGGAYEAHLPNFPALPQVPIQAGTGADPCKPMPPMQKGRLQRV